jgi:hypothetical protein
MGYIRIARSGHPAIQNCVYIGCFLSYSDFQNCELVLNNKGGLQDMFVPKISMAAPRFNGQFLWSRDAGVSKEAVEERLGAPPEEYNDKLLYHQQPDELDLDTAQKMRDVPFAYAPTGENFSRAADIAFPSEKEMLQNVFKSQPGNWTPPNWDPTPPQAKKEVIWDDEDPPPRHPLMGSF